MNARSALFLLVGAVVLYGLFVVLRPPLPVPAPAPVAAPAASATVAAPPPPPPARTELVIRNGALASGPALIQVHEGDAVQLSVTSDHDDELHLHGYDLELALKAGVPGELSFTADRSGRFEYELHHAHLELGALEVQPR
ncbi:MAG TPA: hypothetical protein VM074_02480 [Solimonas sp.]|nr:hypothetical protein [Solimonas sp.]